MKQDKRVIALGFFDGVHLGHGALLRETSAMARRLNAVPSALSFDTPPNKNVPALTSPADRADTIRRLYAIDDLIFLHFDDNLRHMDWERFVEWLREDFRAVGLVAGYDFRFGYRGRGDTALLAEKCAALGLVCEIVPQVTLDGAAVSSTRVRELLASGALEEANRLLGHRHFLTDTVRDGYRLGRRLGFPTVNMRFEEGVLVPRRGVYASTVTLPDTGETFHAVTNIGVRPTVSGSEESVSVESHLLDFCGNLYGRRARVEFWRFLRPEQRFGTVEALREQILRDTDGARSFFAQFPGK